VTGPDGSSGDGSSGDASSGDGSSGDGSSGDGSSGDGSSGDGSSGDGSSGDGRDRDAGGRARNARARDALGRPLPRSAAADGGELPRIPDDLVLTPAEAAALGGQLLADGLPFHAHEVFEAAWKSATGPERELWRGLAQIAVGLTHARRGNARGAVALLSRGAARVREHEHEHEASDLISPGYVAASADELAARISRDARPEPDLRLALRPASS
jgi:hypothetical protein